MKRKIIILCSVIVVFMILFFAINKSTYDNSQSQCEHYKDSQRIQEYIEKNLDN